MLRGFSLRKIVMPEIYSRQKKSYYCILNNSSGMDRRNALVCEMPSIDSTMQFQCHRRLSINDTIHKLIIFIDMSIEAK